MKNISKSNACESKYDAIYSFIYFFCAYYVYELMNRIAFPRILKVVYKLPVWSQWGFPPLYPHRYVFVYMFALCHSVFSYVYCRRKRGIHIHSDSGDGLCEDMRERSGDNLCRPDKYSPTCIHVTVSLSFTSHISLCIYLYIDLFMYMYPSYHLYFIFTGLLV